MLSATASVASTAGPVFLAAAEESRWFSAEILPHERDLRHFLQNRFPALRDVDDVVQESYTRLLRVRRNGHATPTRAYLFVIARNLAFDLLRREQCVARESLEESAGWFVVDERPDAAESASHEQELELLGNAVQALPPRCREILTLRRIEGRSYREISELMGIAQATVNSQLAIGLLRCRQYLTAHGVARATLPPPISQLYHAHGT